MAFERKSQSHSALHKINEKIKRHFYIITLKTPVYFSKKDINLK